MKDSHWDIRLESSIDLPEAAVGVREFPSQLLQSFCANVHQ